MPRCSTRRGSRSPASSRAARWWAGSSTRTIRAAPASCRARSSDAWPAPTPPERDVKPTTRLRQLIAGGDVVVAPGVYDGLSARLAARAGFHAIYATGGGIARSMGYPDLGLLSPREIVDRLANIVEQADVPVIADADTGYGNALNV